MGTVQGDIIASKKLSIKAPAKVSGNISSVVLSIEEGVLFEGKCQMLQATDSKEKEEPSEKGGAATKPAAMAS